MSAFLKRLGAALLAPALLVGCGNDMSDLERYVAEVKSRKSTDIEPIPQPKQYEAFAYVPGGRPDPFIRPEAADRRVADAGNGLRPDIRRNREPLEEFPLDGLRMVGTIVFNNRVYALVRAPDGVVHRVSPGNHMGQNYGEITAIDEGQIQLREIVPDGFGGWMQRPAVISLSP
jgi:type IV pilus assembly protein PilP